MKVEDTGAGIPENKIQELYKPFSRIEENNALASGTGLGLFVTKGIVDILGGEIKINSIVGGGTMFDIKIPVKESESVISRKTHRIKVYDGDALILKMITEMVERLGHKAVDEDYDIIITDMDMGDISGLDILNQAGDTPVYLMTGQCDFTSQKGADMGFAGYMPKPVTLNVLKEMIGVGADD